VLSQQLSLWLVGARIPAAEQGRGEQSERERQNLLGLESSK